MSDDPPAVDQPDPDADLAAEITPSPTDGGTEATSSATDGDTEPAASDVRPTWPELGGPIDQDATELEEIVRAIPAQLEHLLAEVGELRQLGEAAHGLISEGRAEASGIAARLAEVEAKATADRQRDDTLATNLAELVRLNRRADEHVAELHSENQRLRAGELASVTAPMVRDVVRLHDEVDQLAAAAVPEAQDDLALVRSRLLDTLARWGLTPFAPARGETVDATRHNGVGSVASSDGEPGRIASVRRPGFAHDDGRVFRPADIEVFRAPPPPATPATPAPSGAPVPPLDETDADQGIDSEPGPGHDQPESPRSQPEATPSGHPNSAED